MFLLFRVNQNFFGVSFLSCTYYFVPYLVRMDLSLDKLKEAVSLREQIHSLEARLSSLFGRSSGGTSSPSATSSMGGVSAPRGRRGGGGRRPMSAATRAKLAAAARARWANVRSQGGGSTLAKSGPATKATKATKSAKRGGGLTAAGRKKLSEAMKARWAARRKSAGR